MFEWFERPPPGGVASWPQHGTRSDTGDQEISVSMLVYVSPSSALFTITTTSHPSRSLRQRFCP
jgi:hypothetical protein